MTRLATFLLLLLALPVVGAVNLVPNGSFEAGQRWMDWHTYGNLTAEDSQGEPADFFGTLTNDVPTGGGNYSYRMPFAMHLLSHQFYVNTNVHGTNLTATCWVKGSSNGSISWGVVGEDKKTANTTLPGSISFNATWQRFTNTITVSSNGNYYVAFDWWNNKQDADYPMIDLVMVEPAATASSSWSPLHEFEGGFVKSQTGNIYAPADTQTITYRVWNTGAEQSINYTNQFLDTENKVISAGSGSATLAAAGYTDIPITLPSLYGPMKVQAWINGPNSQDETTVIRLLSAPSTSIDHDGISIAHTHNSAYAVSKYRRLGFTHFRTLSPGRYIGRWTLVEPTDDNFDFSVGNTQIAAITNNGGVPIVSAATGLDGNWPTAYQAGGNLTNQHDYYTNYVANLRSNYNNADVWLHALNEVHHDDFGGTWNDPDNAAWLMDGHMTAVEGVDSNSRDIVFEGWPFSYWVSGSNAWAAASAQVKAAEVVSSHQYWEQVNPNGDTRFANDWSNITNWFRVFTGANAYWFTEGGAYGVDWYMGRGSFQKERYNLLSSPTYEADRAELQNRWQYNLEHWNGRRMMIHSAGMEKDAVYEMRHANGNFTSEPKAEVWDDTVKPYVVAHAFFGNIIGNGHGFGRILNTASTRVAAFGFHQPSDSRVTVGLWETNRDLATLTFTNASFEVLDLFGNQIQTNSTTVNIGRRPVILRTFQLTTNQVVEMVQNASFATRSDTTAPYVTIDICPTGLWDATNDWAFVRAYGQDDQDMNYGANATDAARIDYRFKVNSEAFSAWGNAQHFSINTAQLNGDENDTVTVEIRDSAGNTRSATRTLYVNAAPPPPPAGGGGRRVSGRAAGGGATGLGF